MKDYQLLHKYWWNNDIHKVFTFIGAGISASKLQLIDIEHLKEEIDEIMQFLILKNKLYKISVKENFTIANMNISCMTTRAISIWPKTIHITADGLQIVGYKCETVNELEKALENKAFL